MNDFWYFVIAGAVLMGFTAFLLNFLLSGFMMPYLLVKASRGKKILCEVRTPTGSYYRCGFLHEGFLVYKDLQGENHRLNLVDGCVYRTANVYAVDVDEANNCLFKRDDMSAVQGFDAVRYDNLVVRALEKGSSIDKKLVIIMFLAGLTLVVALFAVYFSYMNLNQTGELLARPVSAVVEAGVGTV